MVSEITDIFVDAVDSLNVPSHRFNAGFLATHFGVEQVIRLQVEHTSSLARIDGATSFLLFVS